MEPREGTESACTYVDILVCEFKPHDQFDITGTKNLERKRRDKIGALLPFPEIDDLPGLGVSIIIERHTIQYDTIQK